MGYTPLELERPLAIDRIYSVHYFEYGPDYAFVGESHDFWELVYADKGEVYVTAGEEEKLLKKGQMIFHEPGEFHNVRATGDGAPNIVIISFECNGPAMDFFRHRVVNVSDNERVLLARIVEMAGAAFSTAMGPLGPGFAAAAMLLFAWSSVLGWSQYGAECWCYLFGPETVWAYRLAFLALILPGCTAGFAAVWALADTFNGLMMLPNLIGLFALSGEVAEETRRYLRSRKKTAPPPA